MGERLDFRAMQARETDLVAFAKCFERHGTPRPVEALRWQYLENPTDELLVDLAVAADRLASIYAVQPVALQLAGERALGAQSVDTLVDAGFRGQGLFTTMAEHVYARAEERGVVCIYGFPNASSAPGFFRKLDWVSLDPVPFLVRPLRSGYFVRRALGETLASAVPDLPLPVGRSRLRPNQAVRPLADFGSDLGALWARFSENVRVAVDRSPEYLRWRLLHKPGSRYRCTGLFENDELVAFTADIVVEKHGGRIGYVLELLYEPGRHDAGLTLLREGLRHMAAERADAVLAWAFRHAPNAKAYARAGFVPLPERLRPIELHFGVRPLVARQRDLLADRRSWYISYCDSDTV